MSERSAAGTMPLYDAFGRPIPELPGSNPKTDPPEFPEPELVAPREPQPRASWTSKLRRPWAILIEVCTVLGLVIGFLALRQEIAVDPYVTYDGSDPFSQRFLILNNGPLAIHDVHYGCAITNIETNNPELDRMSNFSIWLMMPTAPHIDELRWKQKTSTDCDFLTHFGTELRSVRIEIEIFYRRWLWRTHGPGWKFSGKRGGDGKFIWDYESNSEGVIEKRDKRIVTLMPFNSPCIIFDLAMLKEDTIELASVAHKYGHKVIAATMLPCSQANAADH
jgi:hypothetical protein